MSPTLTVGSYFRRVRSTFLFICSTTSNLNNFEPQQLEPQQLEPPKRVQNEKKKQNRRSEPRNHTMLEVVEEYMLVNLKGSPFCIFRHCAAFSERKKSNFSHLTEHERYPLGVSKQIS